MPLLATYYLRLFPASPAPPSFLLPPLLYKPQARQLLGRISVSRELIRPLFPCYLYKATICRGDKREGNPPRVFSIIEIELEHLKPPHYTGRQVRHKAAIKPAYKSFKSRPRGSCCLNTEGRPLCFIIQPANFPFIIIYTALPLAKPTNIRPI